jgi:hypothetical protein
MKVYVTRSPDLGIVPGEGPYQILEEQILEMVKITLDAKWQKKILNGQGIQEEVILILQDF